MSRRTTVMLCVSGILAAQFVQCTWTPPQRTAPPGPDSDASINVNAGTGGVVHHTGAGGTGVRVDSGITVGDGPYMGPCRDLECRQTTCMRGNCAATACAPGVKTTVSGTIFDFPIR